MASKTAAHPELRAFLGDVDNVGFVVVYVGTERFVDLHGLRVLEHATRQVRSRGGKLLVVAPPRCLQSMARMTGLAVELSLVMTSARRPPS